MHMTLTSRTDFLLLYKVTAEKLIQIVVLTDPEPRILRTFWECKQSEKPGLRRLDSQEKANDATVKMSNNSIN
jgi:hypothetical protein